MRACTATGRADNIETQETDMDRNIELNHAELDAIAGGKAANIDSAILAQQSLIRDRSMLQMPTVSGSLVYTSLVARLS
jgi:hypothetical protein